MACFQLSIKEKVFVSFLQIISLVNILLYKYLLLYIVFIIIFLNWDSYIVFQSAFGQYSIANQRESILQFSEKKSYQHQFCLQCFFTTKLKIYTVFLLTLITAFSIIKKLSDSFLNRIYIPTGFVDIVFQEYFLLCIFFLLYFLIGKMEFFF